MSSYIFVKLNLRAVQKNLVNTFLNSMYRLYGRSAGRCLEFGID
ncbi:hypothetical protein [Leptospira interrogans]|nr:hypothetical protein [Leptospira interrogans]